MSDQDTSKDVLPIHDQEAALHRLLGSLRKAGFWGRLVLKFRDGNIVLVEQQETIPMSVLASTTKR